MGTFAGYFTSTELGRDLNVKIDDSDLDKQDTSCDQIINSVGEVLHSEPQGL